LNTMLIHTSSETMEMEASTTEMTCMYTLTWIRSSHEPDPLNLVNIAHLHIYTCKCASGILRSLNHPTLCNKQGQ